MSCNHQRPLDGLDQTCPTTARISHSSRRAVGRALLLGLVLLVALAVSPGPATPPASAHGSEANGCTGVVDSGPGFAFHSACDGHDRCYRSHPYGTGSAGRRACDRVFRSEMRRYCRRHGFGLRRVSCQAVASAYYAGVRALGAPFWALHRATPIA